MRRRSRASERGEGFSSKGGSIKIFSCHSGIREESDRLEGEASDLVRMKYRQIGHSGGTG